MMCSLNEKVTAQKPVLKKKSTIALFAVRQKLLLALAVTSSRQVLAQSI